MKKLLFYTTLAILLVGYKVKCEKKAGYSGPKTQLPNDKIFKDPAAFCEGCYGTVQGGIFSNYD